jgi:tetratricopeptide (TPR) repeat protein
LGVTLQQLGRPEDAETSYKTAISIMPNLMEAQYKLGILLLESGRYDQAIKTLKLIQFKNSKSYLLRCLYLQNEKAQFYELLDQLLRQGDVDPIIGSLTCRAEIKYGLVKPNCFCSDPFKYIAKIDLIKSYDFSNTFIRPVTTIFKQNKRPYRLQKLLTNGSQTPGNLFDIERDLTDEIEKTIRIEIEKYRTYFNDSEEGFIKKWPAEYSLTAWLINMKSGGKLRPHMHENGWISGSIYINVPPKLTPDSGSLVVCIDDQDYLVDGKTQHEKIIDVTTGSLCLFPASLLHYTIQFESDEERIVLAFDVVPKSH